ncbi:response regulator [Dyadobacter endophyticus]|uniref:response regulator n=1 Tax=Dyadobacter endophyticus TaxID=1749036 RepID=UPI003CF87675
MNDQPIIIADDDSDDSEYMRTALISVFGQDKQVIQVPNGRELLALAKSPTFRPELIIIDMQMPFISGTDILCKLRDQQHLKQVPLVIMSGDKYNLELAYRAGADGFYSKPTSPEGYLEVATDIRTQYYR